MPDCRVCAQDFLPTPYDTLEICEPCRSDRVNMVDLQRDIDDGLLTPYEYNTDPMLREDYLR